MFHDIRTIQSASIARFGAGATILRARNGAALDESQLRQAAPSVFAEDKHASRSARYTYIPTIEVLRGLGREGFVPVEVRQGGSRVEGKREFTKHLVRMRRVGELSAGDSFRELCLLNAHDGTSSYQLIEGRFVMVCSNGLLTCDGEGQLHKVAHKGDIVRDVIDAAYTIVDKGAETDRVIGDMQTLQLTGPQQEVFAEAASELRWTGDTPAPVTPRQVIQPRRREDAGPSLWHTFNRAQENLTQGGLRYVQRDEQGRARAHRETRAVNGIEGNTALNRALWTLARRMQELAAA